VSVPRGVQLGPALVPHRIKEMDGELKELVARAPPEKAVRPLAETGPRDLTFEEKRKLSIVRPRRLASAAPFRLQDVQSLHSLSHLVSTQSHLACGIAQQWPAARSLSLPVEMGCRHRRSCALQLHTDVVVYSRI